MSDEDLSVVNDFCNVYGDPVDVLESNSGEVFVSLKDVIRTGFKVYKGECFVPSMVDKKQIIKEFEMHMLTAGHNFLLTHQNKNVDEMKVLQTIENCKKKLLGNNSDFKVPSGSGALHRNSNNTTRRHPRENQYKNDNFAPGTSDQEFRPKGYRNSQGPPNRNGFVANAFPSNASVDSQESLLMRMLAGENVPEIDLEIGEVCRFKVCYVVPNKENVCFVHLQSAIPSFEEMMVDIFKTEPDLEVLNNPQEGQLVLGYYEEAWCRAKVIAVNPTQIHFVDYGNRTKTEDLKFLPEKFKTIPAFAIRLKVSGVKEELKVDLPLTVVVKWKYEDRTYIVELCDDDTETEVFVSGKAELNCLDEKDEYEEFNSEDKNRAFFGPLKPLINLKDGTEVKLVNMDDGVMFVKTKECYEKMKEITSYIQQFDTTTLSTVKTNQLVLSSKDDAPGLYRAIVTSVISNQIASVKYLDLPGTDNVSVKSLKNMDEYLAKQPITLLQVTELDGLENLGREAKNLLDEMIKRKERVTVMNHNSKFDLKLNSGQLLSDVLGNC